MAQINSKPFRQIPSRPHGIESHQPVLAYPLLCAVRLIPKPASELKLNPIGPRTCPCAFPWETAVLNLPKKILVVEDDETMRLTLAEVLRREGFEVLTARDGEEGYATALAVCPDLIITDLQMPVLDGVGLARLIRRQRGRLSQAPILALSANLQEYHLPERMSSGINRFFDKAANDRHTLLLTVRTLLEAAPLDAVSVAIA